MYHGLDPPPSTFVDRLGGSRVQQACRARLGYPSRVPAPATINQGDVFWITLDESQGSVPGRPHPHVVIQDDGLNRSRVHTVVVCALTSNLNLATEPGNVLLDLHEGNLPVRSVLVVSQVSSVEKSKLGDYIGTLSLQRVAQVLDGLRFQQASFFRER